MDDEVSKCCGTEFHAVNADEGTSFYVCDNCDMACDVTSERNEQIQTAVSRAVKENKESFKKLAEE